MCVMYVCIMYVRTYVHYIYVCKVCICSMFVCMYACNVCIKYVRMYVRVLRMYIIDIPALSIFRRLTNLKFGLFLYEILNSENNCIFCVTNAIAYINDSSVLFKGNFLLSQKNKKEFCTYVSKYKYCV
jgi:hypothetical protein